MTAAVYYHPEGFDTGGARLLGRHSAGEGFLRAFVHLGEGPLYCQCGSAGAFEAFKKQVASWGADPARARWLPTAQPQRLAEPGAVFLPGPGLAEAAWQRQQAGARGYSLCGITHTTASARVMDEIGQLAVAPLAPWDAVICTSRAVHAMVARVLEDWTEYLATRAGTTPAALRARLPRLPIIPLGVDCSTLASTAGRAALRARHGIGEEDVVVLFVGRLSFHAKAHPLPMYLGLEEAARGGDRRVHLIQAGWFPNAAVREDFVATAAALCPSVNAIFLDGREPEVRRQVWAAADIFTSLADNIQETFGLTPAEAMAAGLPVVVSDWNGYRDTVRHGVDGFRVATVMPAPGAGEDLARRHALGVDSYDRYIGYASQATAVDVAGCAAAFSRLVADAALRRRMGEAGRQRARALYDWPVVLSAYENLWAELAERRQAAAGPAGFGPMPMAAPDAVPCGAPGGWPDAAAGAISDTGPRPAHPLRADPFRLFARYPTHTLGPESVLSATASGTVERLRTLRQAAMNVLGDPVMVPAEAREQLLARLRAEGPMTVEMLLAGTPEASTAAALRSLGWLVKMGLARVVVPG